MVGSLLEDGNLALSSDTADDRESRIARSTGRSRRVSAHIDEIAIFAYHTVEWLQRRVREIRKLEVGFDDGRGAYSKRAIKAENVRTDKRQDVRTLQDN